MSNGKVMETTDKKGSAVKHKSDLLEVLRVNPDQGFIDVSIDIGRTTDLGNYQNIKSDVYIKLSCLPNDLLPTIDKINNMALNRFSEIMYEAVDTRCELTEVSPMQDSLGLTSLISNQDYSNTKGWSREGVSIGQTLNAIRRFEFVRASVRLEAPIKESPDLWWNNLKDATTKWLQHLQGNIKHLPLIK